MVGLSLEFAMMKGDYLFMNLKVAFIQKQAYEKISLHQIFGCLKKLDVQYNVFIEELEIDFYKTVIQYRPNLICYSLFISEELYMLSYFRRLKAALPNAKTVVGGPFTLIFPEIVKNKQVDFVLRGDGENSFPQFLELYRSNKSLENVDGICFVKNDGVIYKNNNIKIISELKNLPSPERDTYYKYENLKKNETKIFTASRGCPYNCSYCYNSELKKFFNSPYWRLKDMESIFEEI